MKIIRKILLLLLFSAVAFGQSTVTVTANLKTIFAANQATKAKACFSLVDATGQTVSDPHVVNTGVLVQSDNVCIAPDANGLISTTIYANDQITAQGVPDSTLWSVQYLYNGSPTHGAVYHFKASDVTENLNTLAPANIVPLVTPALSDAVYMRLDAGNSPATAPWTFPGLVDTGTLSVTGLAALNGNATVGGTLGVTGNSTLAAVTNTSEGTPKFNRVVWLDGAVNTTLAGCLAAAATAKSVCEVPPNYPETVAADITVTNDTGLHFDGVAAINMGTHQFKCAGGTCNDFFIDSDIPFGSNGSPSAGVVFTYTGTTTPFSFGDATADTFGISLRNFAVNVSGGGAAVSAIKLNRVHPFKMENIRLIGTTGQIGVNEDGTGGYTGNGDISNLFANGFTSCVKMTAEGNFNRIFASCPNTATGGKTIDITDGNGNLIYLDAENATVGLNFGNSANVFGNRVLIYGQGNTTDAVFGAASIANTVDNVGANCGGIVPTVSDSGTSNSFWNPCKFKMDVNGNFTISGKLTTGSAGLSINGGTALVNQTGTGTSVVTNTSPTISGTTTLQRIAAAGTSATSCAVTGAGASGSCSFPVVSTDSYGIMRIAAAGAGPAATGTLTLTLSSSIGTFAVCTFTPSSANTAWNARASALQTNYSATAPVMAWDNNAVALVAGSSYDVTYKCEGH